MTIEEAIRNYEESERINTDLAENCVSAMAKNHNLDNAEKCRQMIAWLRELQERRKEPEIVRCKDCIYYNWDIVDAPYGMTKMICWCDLHYDAVNDNLAVNPDDFCSRAERRTDEVRTP